MQLTTQNLPIVTSYRSTCINKINKVCNKTQRIIVQVVAMAVQTLLATNVGDTNIERRDQKVTRPNSSVKAMQALASSLASTTPYFKRGGN